MRRLVVLLVGLALAVGVSVVAEPATAAGPPLSDYVIYGESGVVIGVDSTIVGLVGAKNNMVGVGAAIRMNGHASIVNDATDTVLGNARSGGNVRMDNHALIEGTLIHAPGTALHQAASAAIGTLVVADPELPALPAATAIPGGCPTAGPDETGGTNQSRAPAPGTYGDWKFGGAFTLDLTTPGTYVFNSITAGNGAVINAVEGVTVLICDDSIFGSVRVLPANLDPTKFTVEAHGTHVRNALRMGGNSHWVGNVYTPNGGIHLGSGGSIASFKGQFVAGGIVDIEHGVHGTGPGGGNEQRPSDDKDATLDHSAKNKNNGATLSLWAKSQVASVVGFDARAIDTASVTKATLRLTVCNTPGELTFCPTPSNNWPAAGGPLHMSRLVDGWERWGSGFPNPTNTPPEGNGNNFPIDNNPHGNGAGVTWNCAIDTNVANESQDCTVANNFWNAGLNFEGPGRVSVPLLTDDMPDGTVIEFDVTADVQAGLGPLDTTYMTWFIRKVPNTGSGEVFFYSIEGAAAKGNPNIAPQLVIVP